MGQLDRDRLIRLQRAARAGQLIRTKQGVFESNSCSVCGFHHKVSLLLKNQPPCPGTDAGVKYYNRNRHERELLESFLLNQGAKIALENGVKVRDFLLSASETSLPKGIPEMRATSPSGAKSPRLPQAKSPRLPRSKSPARGGYKSPRSVSPAVETERTKGRLLAKRNQQPPAHQTTGPRARAMAAKKGNRQGGTPSPDNVFFGNELGSSDFSDPEGVCEKDLERQLMREMYTQEEEALRFRLALEREKHQNNMK